MDAAIAALLGTGIGAVASVGAMWVQQQHQNRRDRLKMAVDLAIHDHKSMFELATAKGAKIAPVSAFVIYHARILDEITKGSVTAETIARISSETTALGDVFPTMARSKREL